MRASKTMRYLKNVGKVAVLSGLPLLAVPGMALGDTWTSDVTGKAGELTGGKPSNTLPTGNLATNVSSKLTLALALAIIAFILKIVLTAVDRMLFDNGNNGNQTSNGSTLVNIPVIGAYPQPMGDGDTKGYTWKRVWTNFAIQLAIAIGAYFFVTLTLRVILAVFKNGLNIGN